MSFPLIVTFVISGFFAILLILNLARSLISEEVWRNWHARVAVLLVLVFVASWINGFFLRPLIIEGFIGGDAIRGKIEGGRYFIRGNTTKDIEVSRNMYYFTYGYSIASEVTAGVSFAMMFAYFYYGHRHGRSMFARRIGELRKRNDIEALYELMELLDFARGDGFWNPPIELYDLRVAINEKTKPVMIREDEPLTLSLQATPAEWNTQKEAWLQWIRVHEVQLRECFSEGPKIGRATEKD